MRPDLIRKTINGLEEFRFVNSQLYFFVKNMSKEPCYIGFEPGATEAESIKVLPGTGEEVSLTYARLYDARSLRTNVLYVRGKGEIEIQGMEVWVGDASHD